MEFERLFVCPRCTALCLDFVKHMNEHAPLSDEESGWVADAAHAQEKPE